MTATDEKINWDLNHIWNWQKSEGLKAKLHNILKYGIFGIESPVFASEEN